MLDNCEHVLDAAADLAAAVVDRCPGVVVVATSREPLDLEGEQVVPVRPLDPATDAVSLFGERARSVDPEFVLDDDDRRGGPGDLQPTRRCAPRGRARGGAGRHDVTRRHRHPPRRPVPAALVGTPAVGRPPPDPAATLEWSHQLLDEAEQVLFRRLGVFAGGFTADAVRAVCGDDGALASLVRKSLVQFEREPAPGRYRLLETVRVFALGATRRGR